MSTNKAGKRLRLVESRLAEICKLFCLQELLGAVARTRRSFTITGENLAFRLAIILPLLLLVCGCRSHQKDDVLVLIQEKATVGGREYEREYMLDAQGKRHGIDYEHYTNGMRRVRSSYNHGLHVGYATWWYENGQKKSETYYDNKKGVKQGIETSWYASGQKKSEIGFLNDEGLYSSTWDTNGELVSHCRFKDNTAWDGTMPLTDNPSVGQVCRISEGRCLRGVCAEGTNYCRPLTGKGPGVVAE